MYNWASLIYRQLFVAPPEPLKDVSSKFETALVTGATAGLGLETAKILLKAGVRHLILSARDLQKGHAVREMLLKEVAETKFASTIRIEVFELDQESYASCQAFVQFLQNQHIDIVILNAGIRRSTQTLSKATGAESTIQVNHYSTALLSTLLLPLLMPRSPGECPGRLTIVSSEGHYLIPEEWVCRADMLEYLDTLDPKLYSPQSIYGISKLFNCMWTRELALRVSCEQIIINTVSPGFCKSDILREQQGLTMLINGLVTQIFARTTVAGAQCIVHGATKAGEDSHGKFLSEGEVFPYVPAVQPRILERAITDTTEGTLHSLRATKEQRLKLDFGQGRGVVFVLIAPGWIRR